LNQYALIKAQSKDYVKETQINLILTPIINQLFSSLGSAETVETVLLEILASLQNSLPIKTGYISGNIINRLPI